MPTLGTAPDKHCLFCGRLSSSTEDTVCNDDGCSGDYINMCTHCAQVEYDANGDASGEYGPHKVADCPGVLWNEMQQGNSSNPPKGKDK